jgi:type VI protein secretion system component Hcp
MVLNISQNDAKGSGGKEVVFSTITLTNASISNYKTFHGSQGPTSNHPRPGSMNVHTYELEEFDLTFQKITYTNHMGSTSSSDDWLAPGK